MFLVCYEDQSAHMCSSENSLKPFNNCSVIRSERVRNVNNFRASLKVFANNSRKKKKKERSALAHIYNFFLYVNLHTPFSITQVFALKMKANASDNFIGDKEIISSLFQSSLLVSWGFFAHHLFLFLSHYEGFIPIYREGSLYLYF